MHRRLASLEASSRGRNHSWQDPRRRWGADTAFGQAVPTGPSAGTGCIVTEDSHTFPSSPRAPLVLPACPRTGPTCRSLSGATSALTQNRKLFLPCGPRAQPVSGGDGAFGEPRGPAVQLGAFLSNPLASFD